MPQIRIALAQINSTVGGIEDNADLIVRMTAHAASSHAHLVAFPELALTGYPVEDLALRSSFVDASRAALERLAARLDTEGLGSTAVVVGYLGRHDPTADVQRLGLPKGSPQNAVAVLYGGRVVSRQAKHHLPNYGVFDEFRYFVPGDHLGVFRLHGVDVALAVCEDLWQEGGPVSVAREAGAGLLLVVNASPYERNKDDTRLELARRRAAEAQATLAYVNMVGGQDELVFDGDSLIVGADGELLARAPQFDEGCLIADLTLPEPQAPAPGPWGVAREQLAGFDVLRTTLTTEPLPGYAPEPGAIAPRLSDHAEVYAAVVNGLRDYVRKNDFPSVTIALSGGIDSALTAAVAVDAVGAENVYGVSMPSVYSSEHSKSDAQELAERTGLNLRTVPIVPMVRSFLDNLPLTGTAEENLQARVRGMTLMGLSNQEGHLVLATGNKTELAVGYSTIYGDAVGGYAPLKDVPKTMTWELARWRNAAALDRDETPPIPQGSIDKVPSAELRPDQRDSDTLPDYALLDDILDHYVEQDRGATELQAAGFDPDTVSQVLRMVDNAEYKRRQYPPGPKISVRNFGRDRRVPITSAWRESSGGVAEPAESETTTTADTPTGGTAASPTPTGGTTASHDSSTVSGTDTPANSRAAHDDQPPPPPAT
ncbi:NAD+ synthase (glutamine-hydrolysing) [Haloactinopolyspora alba]|uniref:Glutamine-dependent NAD(+) synthetase n=1 Tax=Haloactinopolyspora alba TaxID=648780 RepID=A0A2P8DRG5_9ACTN|nr:NAD+ synthase [Haloactinopolyspora alba]PSK99805.1 NAD+ synthase (glutamine-hydrolysing) [Haloactinopolyspora alba]